MLLRSEIVLGVHDALVVAADDGYGLRTSELKRLVPSQRNVFGVIWEMRRWGAETISIKRGRKIVGWVLMTTIQPDATKADEPSTQISLEYDKSFFRPVITKPKVRRKAFIARPNQLPTNAASKLSVAA